MKIQNLWLSLGLVSLVACKNAPTRPFLVRVDVNSGDSQGAYGDTDTSSTGSGNSDSSASSDTSAANSGSTTASTGSTQGTTATNTGTTNTGTTTTMTNTGTTTTNTGTTTTNTGNTNTGNTTTTTMTAGMSLTNVLTEAQFNQMFPNRNPFYTYQGLVAAADATPNFAKEGDMETRKREVAALLANGAQEADQFKATREYNMANWDKYCDNTSAAAPCAAGQQYYGRGPIQISWNFNYKAAGDFLGMDLLHNPDIVATDAKVAWQTMMWYWMTQNGPGTMTCHQAMVGNKGFGETIKSINGAVECNGKYPSGVANRIQFYKNTSAVLGNSLGTDNLGC